MYSVYAISAISNHDSWIMKSVSLVWYVQYSITRIFTERNTLFPVFQVYHNNHERNPHTGRLTKSDYLRIKRCSVLK